ncbi:MAG: hypothetical protein Kow0037_00310 [Calditrichia bacterium]
MALTKTLLNDSEARVIGLMGGKGRDFLATEIASELQKAGKTVVVTHQFPKTLPLFAPVVCEKTPAKLKNCVSRHLQEGEAVFVGCEMKDDMASGIKDSQLKALLELENLDYLLLLLGSPETHSLQAEKHFRIAAENKFLDLMFYVFQATAISEKEINRVADPGMEWLKKLGDAAEKPLEINLALEYLSENPETCARLKEAEYPVELILTDVNGILAENIALNLARELASFFYRNIYLADLKETQIKKVKFS